MEPRQIEAWDEGSSHWKRWDPNRLPQRAVHPYDSHQTEELTNLRNHHGSSNLLLSSGYTRDSTHPLRPIGELLNVSKVYPWPPTQNNPSGTATSGIRTPQPLWTTHQTGPLHYNPHAVMGVRGPRPPEHLGISTQDTAPSPNTSYVGFHAELFKSPSHGPQPDAANIDIVPHLGTSNFGLNGAMESSQLTLNLSDSRETRGHQELYIQPPDTSETAHIDGASRSLEPQNQEDEVVCFGMITGIDATIPKYESIRFETDTSATLKSSSAFCLHGDSNLEGSIDNDSNSGNNNVEMLSILLQSPQVEMEAHCIVRDELSAKRKKRKYGQGQSCPCMISVIVYGPLAMFDDVGTFFEKWEVHLQNPRNCGRSVKYCNPHHLSWTDFKSSALTSELQDDSRPSSPQMEALDSAPDLLEILNAEEMISEAKQPHGTCTPLEKHQKQALSFMTRRETDDFLSSDKDSLWEVRRFGETNIFINKVSGEIEKEKPPNSRGGVLADPMGLGKTLAMISLILSGLESKITRPLNVPAQRTLVVVPLPLLNVWEEQLSRHVRKGTISWYRHHDRGCLKSVSDLETYDMVLTTYDTVTSEWKKCCCPGFQRPVLFAATWKRLILDEAHLIRNPKSQRARAACALNASSRWAVTGTPIQNSLQDLASILAFLRIYPYSDPKIFKSDITSLWKAGHGDEALRRLKLLVRCFFLRRPKTAIDLPVRHDLRCPLEFRPEERSFYLKFKAEAMEEIEKALIEESASTANANVLKRIDALRTICNLGTRYRETSKARRNDWDTIAQNTFDVQRELGILCCSACEIRPLDIEDAVEETSPHQFFRCLYFICSECSESQTSLGCELTCNCDKLASCEVAPVYMGNRSKNVCATGPVQLHERLPTKIEAIVSEIKGLDADEKCVVFSMWRSTLDLVQTGLGRCGISSLRYDGGLSIEERHKAVARFQEDPSLRVLVLTLSCRAVGLTLTAARRAYLMEPHWNPTQEDQALAIIHRLGQTQNITTVRYFVKDTYEESVKKLQKSKRLLADMLLAKDGDSHKNNRLDSLQVLQTLI